MPELGPYGSMRGEVRENLPYRDFLPEGLSPEPARRDAGRRRDQGQVDGPIGRWGQKHRA
jgi:hypothetical protein